MSLVSFTLFINSFCSSALSETVTIEYLIVLNSLSKFSISRFRSLKIVDVPSEIIYKFSMETWLYELLLVLCFFKSFFLFKAWLVLFYLGAWIWCCSSNNALQVIHFQLSFTLLECLKNNWLLVLYLLMPPAVCSNHSRNSLLVIAYWFNLKAKFG